MSKIIFCGAFDPVHNGHINMALKASETLDSDVFFVLSPISVWKKLITPVEHKINMLKIVCDKNPRFHLDLYEVNSGEEVNYSIDTVKHFVKTYPNEKLYFLIGGDQVERFHEWKDAYEISKLAQIVYFRRNGYNFEHQNIFKFNMMAIPGETVDADSTSIRLLNNMEIPDDVGAYIEENRLYFMRIISDLLSEDRIKHSISVANVAYYIAKKNNLKNPKKYYIAGLLHDIGKDKDIEKKINVRDVLRGYEDLSPATYHQFYGAVLARQLFDINDPEVLQAIRFHTTGRDIMSPVAIVVYVADKIEPLRQIPDGKHLLDLMCEDYLKGFSEVLKSNIKYFESKNINYKNRYTLACIKQYMN